MNTFTAVAVLALLAYTANATPCTDICNGECVIDKETCDLEGIFGDLCNVVYGVCTQTCTATCGCADGCAVQCGGQFATCQGDASSGGQLAELNVLSCGLNLEVCSEECQAKCEFNVLAGMVKSLGGAGGARR